MPLRLGILLSGSGSTYANLVEAVSRAAQRIDIAVVVASRADAGGVARARSMGHPVVIASEGETVTAALREHQASWVAMCGWMRYWDPPAEFGGKVFNIHPSLLPAFGGRGMYGIHVHRAVLAAGVAVSGCTVHLVSGAYDSGPVLAQRRVGVLSADTPESLQERVQAAERELYPQVVIETMCTRS
jgi:phosphoribosylglycinamide formyltransferase-1